MMKMILFCFLLAAFLPFEAAAEFPDIPGWEGAGEPRWFGPDNLWDEINGGAEIFVGYGFRRLDVREIARDDVIVSVGIYDMTTPLNAFGMYRTESREDEESRDIGTRAYVVAPYMGLLLKDRYYVKVGSYDGKLDDGGFDELLRAVAGVLPGEEKLPPELALLPADGKKEGSDHFVREAFLGLKELRNCVFGRYPLGEEGEYRIFHIVPAGDRTADEVWQKLSEKWVEVERDETSILVRNVPYQGPVGIVRKDGAIYGVADIESEDVMIEKLLALAAAKAEG